MASIDPDLNFFDYSPTNYSSPYYTVDEFRILQENQSNISSPLKLISHNIRSFQKNSDCFTALLFSLKCNPDVIILNETWLQSGSEHLSNLENYKVFHTIRDSNLSGGVSLYFKPFICAQKLDLLSVCTNSIESIVVKFKNADEIFYMVGIYRPHTGTINNFITSLTELLNQIPDLNRNKVLITGDLNINLLSNSPQVEEFCDFLRSYFFVPLVTKPTRFSPIDGVLPSLLDHVWVNFIHPTCKAAIVLSDQTDHCPIYIEIFNRICSENETIKITFRDHSEENIIRFKECLSNISWDSQFVGDVNNKFIIFNNLIVSLYKSNFPLKTKNITKKHLSTPWITPHILNCIRIKSSYFKLYKQGIIDKTTNDYKKNSVSNYSICKT